MRLLEFLPSRCRALLGLIVLLTGLVTVIFLFDLDRLQLLRAAGTTRNIRISQWTWTCEKKSCVRRDRNFLGPANSDKRPWSSLSTCRMTCGTSQIIWPEPTGTVTLGNSSSSFDLNKVKIRSRKKMLKYTWSMLQEAFDIFKMNLKLMVSEEQPSRFESPEDFVLEVKVITQDQHDTLLSLGTNEGYKLTIERKDASRRVVATVIAGSFFGARHGLETLSQLVWWDEGEMGIGTFRVLNTVTVEDEPRFSYRGLMVDTARNFMPVPALRRTIDGMAASKLNVLHLHLTDTQSFPFESPRFPQLAQYGAYSPEQKYTAQDVRGLTEYAQVRGVRLLGEIDAPSHAGSGWQWGENAGLGALAVCVNQQPWKRYCGQPPCGQLNPTNNYTYLILHGLYQDLVELTNVTDLFHMGGDEVNENCWTSSPDVFESGTNPSLGDFWDKVNEFHDRALRELVAANGGVKPRGVIVWSNSGMPDEEYLRTFPPEHYVIQEWGGSTWRNTLQHLRMKYRVILSHVDAWYLDCGFGQSAADLNQPCAPVSSVRRVYEHRPWKWYEQGMLAQVLGGEACLWSEKADHHVLDARLWPRGAALAERLWTDPPDNQDRWGDIFLRLAMHRERLVSRGVRADVVWPQWCHDNPGEC